MPEFEPCQALRSEHAGWVVMKVLHQDRRCQVGELRKRYNAVLAVAGRVAATGLAAAGRSRYASACRGGLDRRYASDTIGVLLGNELNNHFGSALVMAGWRRARR